MGIVGPAGAGKSTLAQMICSACRRFWEADGAPWIQCVSMDGYMYPNSYLVAQSAKDHLGNPCSLKDIKGAPSTLDVEGLIRDLDRLRSRCCESVLLPSYDRNIHDPVPESIAVDLACRVVVIEGLHLLHTGDKWPDVSSKFHRTVFLDMERGHCFERVVGRKVSNGRSRQSSEAHFARVDGPTFDQLQEEKKLADVILKLCPRTDRALHVANVRVNGELGDSQQV